MSLFITKPLFTKFVKAELKAANLNQDQTTWFFNRLMYIYNTEKRRIIPTLRGNQYSPLGIYPVFPWFTPDMSQEDFVHRLVMNVMKSNPHIIR